MENPEPSTQNTVNGQMERNPMNAFQRVKQIMSEPIRPPEPYTDSEIEALRQQEPLSETDLPNNGMQLSAEEINDPNQLQLI